MRLWCLWQIWGMLPTSSSPPSWLSTSPESSCQHPRAHFGTCCSNLEIHLQMLQFQNLVSSSIVLSPSLSSSDSLMSSNLFFGLGASTLSLATSSSPFSKSSSALSLRQHPSHRSCCSPWGLSTWGPLQSPGGERRRPHCCWPFLQSPQELPSSSLRCVWCQNDSDLDFSSRSDILRAIKSCRANKRYKTSK